MIAPSNAADETSAPTPSAPSATTSRPPPGLGERHRERDPGFDAEHRIDHGHRRLAREIERRPAAQANGIGRHVRGLARAGIDDQDRRVRAACDLRERGLTAGDRVRGDRGRMIGAEPDAGIAAAVIAGRDHDRPARRPHARSVLRPGEADREALEDRRAGRREQQARALGMRRARRRDRVDDVAQHRAGIAHQPRPHSAARRFWPSRIITKNGPPSTAVTAPVGSCAGAITMRASVSHNVSSTAPPKIDAGNSSR